MNNIRLTVRLSGSPMLVTGLAKQAPRPKRIDTLTLPLASFGDPLIAGVRHIQDKYAHADSGKTLTR